MIIFILPYTILRLIVLASKFVRHKMFLRKMLRLEGGDSIDP